MKNKNQKKKIFVSAIPKLDLIPKKEYEGFISLIEFEIREYYKKLQITTKEVPP